MDEGSARNGNQTSLQYTKPELGSVYDVVQLNFYIILFLSLLLLPMFVTVFPSFI